MLLKILALLAVLLVIYIVFFKKPKLNSDTPKKKSKSKKVQKGDTMMECTKCSTFVSEDDAIIKDGQFYCSKSCAGLK